MITVQGLTKRYARTIAVDNVSFEVTKGEIVGFLGPNGAGKTTTMRVLTCFLPPTGGTATVAGYDVLEQPMEVKRRIGYLPESPPLYPEMEVIEYLTFVGQLKQLRGQELKKRVDYVIERCAVGDVRTKLIGKLSKGYRQRVGLAQAIVHNPVVQKETHEQRGVFEVESLKDRFIRGDLARAVVESGWNLNELRPEAMSLEEVFLQLTGGEKAVEAPE